jgi:two-component system chemotaxis response regulator CheB
MERHSNIVRMGASSHLADILDKDGPLPVVRARSGQRVERGKVYVAVPQCHLLLRDRFGFGWHAGG